MRKHNIEIRKKVVKISLLKDLRNSRKLKKVVAIHKIKNVVLSKKEKKIYKLEAQKKYLSEKVAVPDLFLVTTLLTTLCFSYYFK